MYRRAVGCGLARHRVALLRLTDAEMTVVRRPGRAFCQLGQLASEVGWKHFDLIKVCTALHYTATWARGAAAATCEPCWANLMLRAVMQRLEASRKTRAVAFYEKKKAATKLRAQAAEKVSA